MLFLSLSLFNPFFFQNFLLILHKRYVHLLRDIAPLEKCVLSMFKEQSLRPRAPRYLLSTTRVSTESPLSPFPTGKYQVVSVTG